MPLHKSNHKPDVTGKPHLESFVYASTLSISLEIQSLGVLNGLYFALNLRIVSLSIILLMLLLPLIKISTFMIIRLSIIAAFGGIDEPERTIALRDNFL